MRKKDLKIALVYDRVNKWGGAERVLLSLHELFPKAPLYTSVYNAKNAPWAAKFRIKTSFLQKMPKASQMHELYAPLMPIAFEKFDFSKYDVVISVSSEAAKGVKTNSVLHINICLTPTRYLWSGYDEYFKNPFFRVLSKPLVIALRHWDKKASKRPDYMIAISKTVQNRIKKYYKRDSVVIYPPAALAQASWTGPPVWLGKRKTKRTSPFSLNSSSYFLVVSRLSKLTAYKRVDLAIKAANKLKLPLKIVGTGRDLSHYKNMAGDTVEFVGLVSDEELAEYYKNAQALIFPGNEDFGLVMVESLMYGTPVVAFNAGGAQEIVTKGKTGEFFDKQTVSSLTRILAKFDKSRYNKSDCRKGASKFLEENFKKEFLAFFDKMIIADR